MTDATEAVDATEALEPDETVRERLPLRTGGAVVVTDDRLLVESDELTRVDLDDVAEVTVEDFDWFLGVLSALLVGYGLYSVPRNAALGLAFAAFGGASLYWAYRKRGKARVRVVGRPKPISVFPADAAAFYDALEPVLVEAEVEEGSSVGE